MVLQFRVPELQLLLGFAGTAPALVTGDQAALTVIVKVETRAARRLSYSTGPWSS